MPRFTPEQVHKTMRAIRSKDTKPEEFGEKSGEAVVLRRKQKEAIRKA